MATLDLSLVIFVYICRICSAVLKPSAADLEQKIRDEFALHEILHRDREPGVAMFHHYQDRNFTAEADHGYINNTLIQDGHIENFTLQFEAFGKRFLLDLHLTRDLFSSSYSRKILREKGKNVKESLHRKERCYYQGQLRDNPLSHAALSSCSGFRGYISNGKDTYHIDPLDNRLHRIFRNSDRKKLPFKCGTEGHDVYRPPSQVFAEHSRRKRSIRGPYDSNKFTRFVELYLVSDWRTYNKHGKNATVVFQRSQDIANIVNSLYRQLNIYIVLVGVEVWSTGDKISVTTSADSTMENFLRYRKERINPYHPNDNAQLITGVFFDHGVVGKAIKGPICTHQFSGGVSMDYDGLVTLVATTMAHEMGHNFGMEHDNDTKCSCPQDKCIMAATSGQVSPQHWSSCSRSSLQEAFELGMDYCLRNPPKTIFDGPVCGNGFVEDGEECDCGMIHDCTNRCCNATSCQMHPQAMCATGRCCDLNTCKPKGGASLCREPTGECDLPEYCNGATEFCPPDVNLQDGEVCHGGQSYCYKGKCNTHNAQCRLLWGSTGRVSDPICFQQLNVNGDHDGNCGYNWTTDKYSSCDRENVMCGLLHCVHLNEKLMFWRDNLALDMRANFLTRGNTQYVCRSTMLDVGLDMPDPGLVPDGAKCEDHKICLKQACTPLMKLKIPKCPDCHSNGVCNSEGHCHCHVGYAPPLCDRPGYGGSLDSGPASSEYAKRGLLIGLLVLFLVILPLVALAFLAYINRQRLLAWWKLGPRIKFGVLKPNQSPSPAPPPPRPSAGLSAGLPDKRRSAPPPGKTSTTLDISGPVLEDPPSYDSLVRNANTGAAAAAAVPPPSAPPPTTRPIFKPSAVPPKLNPPAPSRPPPVLAAAREPPSRVPEVTVVGRERRNFFSVGPAATVQPAADGAPADFSAADSNRSVKLLPVHLAAESTLKRQQKEREAAAAESSLKRQQREREEAAATLKRQQREREATEAALRRQQKEREATETLKRQQSLKREKEPAAAAAAAGLSPPTSPTKAGRRLGHSQSLRGEGPGPKDPQLLAVADNKLVKRDSFRGAEISSPILVSTTNRDSQVFADFELDQSGVVARPIGKQHSVHGSNPASSSDAARDGSRSAVRRSQSDRPLSPKRSGGAATDSLKKASHASQHPPGFTPRPLPPEPVLESEPLYINSGLSDLGDLTAHIGNLFDGLSQDTSPPSQPAPPPPASKPAAAQFNSVRSPASQNLASAALASAAASAARTSSGGKPAEGPAPASLRPAFGGKASEVSAPTSSRPTFSSKAAESSNPTSSRPTFGSKAAESSNPTSSRPTFGSKAVESPAPTSSGTAFGGKATALERVLNKPIKSPFGGGVTSPPPSSSSSAQNTAPPATSNGLAKTAVTNKVPLNKNSTASSGPVKAAAATINSGSGNNKPGVSGNKAAADVSSGPKVRGPFGSAATKTSEAGKDSEGSTKTPGSAKNAVGAGTGPSKTPTAPATITNKRSAPSSSLNKTPASSVSKLAATGGVNKAASFNAGSKGPASSGTAGRGGSASANTGAVKSSGVGSAGSNPVGRGSGVQRSSSAVGRPTVAPKPGAAAAAPKPVRSYNF